MKTWFSTDNWAIDGDAAVSECREAKQGGTWARCGVVLRREPVDSCQTNEAVESGRGFYVVAVRGQFQEYFACIRTRAYWAVC
jgi:hypothetical protein